MTAATKRLLVTLSLVGVCAVWGGTFVMVKDAVSAYPLYAFLGWRFAIAVVAFMMLFPGTFRRFAPGTIRVGLLAGLFLIAGYVFQTWGLQGTTASKAAFITGMFVVITPAMQAVVLRRPPQLTTVVGVVLAVVGLWLLSGANADGWTPGDTRVLLCAIAYSAHMIVLGGPGRRHDARALTLVQLAVTGLACGGVSLVAERPYVWPTSNVWVALVVTGVLASAVAFAVQTYAQRILSPAKTALVLIMEPVFGGIFGWMAGDALGIKGIAGAALIFCGMLTAEFLGSAKGPSEHIQLEAAIEGPSVAVIESGPVETGAE